MNILNIQTIKTFFNNITVSKNSNGQSTRNNKQL